MDIKNGDIKNGDIKNGDITNKNLKTDINLVDDFKSPVNNLLKMKYIEINFYDNDFCLPFHRSMKEIWEYFPSKEKILELHKQGEFKNILIHLAVCFTCINNLLREKSFDDYDYKKDYSYYYNYLKGCEVIFHDNKKFINPQNSDHLFFNLHNGECYIY